MQIDHRTEILKADVSSVSPSSERAYCFEASHEGTQLVQ